jgi:triosephosphate isomerase (TIM)
VSRRRQVLAANWKLNLAKEGIEPFCAAVGRRTPSEIEVVVAPPFPYLFELSGLSKANALAIAAQNCAEQVSGAFTGEVSAGMVADTGARYVIIGHSERRTLYGETDEVIGRKLDRARAAGLVPIFCIGESEQLRDEGKTLETLKRQIDAALSTAGGDFSWLIVAYEPVWAIGTGKNATALEVREAHQAVAEFVKPHLPAGTFSILYGGSVKPSNAGELAAIDDVDGFLVGGASLAADSFLGIYEPMRG